MNQEDYWRGIALEYRKEIELLHNDIETAIAELEKKMPRSFETGIGILDYALRFSQQNLHFIKILERPIIVKTSMEKKPDSLSDMFGDIL